MKKLVTFLCLLAFFVDGSAREIRAVLEPKERATITAEIRSTVTKILRRMGESFKKDEELIRLDDIVFKANLMKAEARKLKAQTDFEGREKLYKDRVISHSEFREAEAILAEAKADLVLAQKSYDSCFINAPYDGKVVTVFVKEHEPVKPDQNLISVIDDHILIARLLIPEQLLSHLKIDDSLTLRIQETGKDETAIIKRIGAVIDPVSSLVKVEAEVDNSKDKLKSGMEGILMLDKRMSRP